MYVGATCVRDSAIGPADGCRLQGCLKVVRQSAGGDVAVLPIVTGRRPLHVAPTVFAQDYRRELCGFSNFLQYAPRDSSPSSSWMTKASPAMPANALSSTLKEKRALPLASVPIYMIVDHGSQLPA